MSRTESMLIKLVLLSLPLERPSSVANLCVGSVLQIPFDKVMTASIVTVEERKNVSRFFIVGILESL